MREASRKVLRAFVVGAITTLTTSLGEADDLGTPATTVAASLPSPAGGEMAPPSRVSREPSSLTPRLRARGYNACYMPDPGFGRYSHWQRVGMGHMIAPLRGGRTVDGGYDVVVHFHGREAVRHAFVEVAEGVVLVGVDLGSTSAPYQRAFDRPEAFVDLLDRVTRALAVHSGDPRAHIRHLAVSSWSAGQGAVRKIVAQFGSRIDAVVLLDSLHSGYEPGGGHRVAEPPIAGVMDFAARAARGEAVLFLSHSQVVPPGYPSTTEVADHLLAALDASRAPRQGTSPLGAELASGFDRGGLHVRGYLGGDKTAHCAHVELLAEVVRDYLEPAWETPTADDT
jgi:hypothetical protein